MQNLDGSRTGGGEGGGQGLQQLHFDLRVSDNVCVFFFPEYGGYLISATHLKGVW